MAAGIFFNECMRHGLGPEEPRLSLGALPGPPAATMAATWTRRRAFCAAPASRNAVTRSDGAQSTFPNSCMHTSIQACNEQRSPAPNWSAPQSTFPDSCTHRSSETCHEDPSAALKACDEQASCMAPHPEQPLGSS